MIREEALRPVSFVVDEALKARLRLASKHRRARVFVEAGGREEAVREAIGVAVPPLRRVDYGLETVEGSFESSEGRLRVRVVARGGTVEGSSRRQNKSFIEASAYQMLSWYCFFESPLEVANATSGWDVESARASLAAAWDRFGALGRAYVAPEGINAQLAVPVETMADFEAHHGEWFSRLARDGVYFGPVPPLNLDVEVSRADFDARKPFRALHVRPRAQIVADDGAAVLDLSDAGREASPADWHAKLGGDFGGGSAAAAAAAAAAERAAPVVVLDCRNHYESAVGTFAGARPLGTETFKETYEKLDRELADLPRETEIMMFCTGGIRCVKAGAHVKQKLGFKNVTRLAGGVVNYTRHLREEKGEDRVEEASQFRGVNYVFNDRMGEPVSGDVPAFGDDEPLDVRAAEALALARKTIRSDEIEAYAERLSGEEPPVLARVRLDASARWPRASRMLCGPTQGRLLAMLCRLHGATRALELGTFCGYGALWLASALGATGRVVTVDRDPRAAAVARTHFHYATAAHPDWAPIDLVEADTTDFLRTTLEKLDPFDVAYLDADKKGYANAVDALIDTARLRPGGLIVADNTLWKGRILGVESAGAPVSAEEADDRDRRARHRARARARLAGEDEDAAEKAAALAAKAERRDRAIQQSMSHEPGVSFLSSLPQSVGDLSPFTLHRRHEFNIKLRKDPRFEQIVLPLRDGLTIARLRPDL
ncbi:hypothetical protein CTAYLR_006446 [Chrysophaeum taylorii]|uniref:Rhodanese domain-containing protein n=1 Tax=Chrysophaeum taylorii TaxID=2483200 RepID=A0AAD7UKY7_9STRA|nr:hypothetical protein CTAYLR_006446 [Chrysophaeum taylorii]